ncbi:hypothetical protein E3_0480 [Rhodococcus phage E3]|uniref:hypothetical protein n=1 Tax=Rhodococcus phage E3 TaxID=1007869 RepID=UPI0002C6AD98|nr:hypothetical protein M176_gp052 [Rhodococcus phage E3]AEQ20962.1 hypothetical protein E3_0480 [Rhodococcus phage E3]
MKIRKRWVVTEDGIKVMSRHWTRKAAERSCDRHGRYDVIALLIVGRITLGEWSFYLPPHVYTVEEDV